MRRSVFYMGQRFTVRHLNHVRSPLLTGYIRPSSLNVFNNGLIQSPLVSSASTLSTASSAELAVPTASISAISQLLATIASNAALQGHVFNFLTFQNISTCVFACEKVCLGFKQRIC